MKWLWMQIIKSIIILTHSEYPSSYTNRLVGHFIRNSAQSWVLDNIPIKQNLHKIFGIQGMKNFLDSIMSLNNILFTWLLS